jgi:nitrite reductase/ring-hydroxylating ferredoxin subunit
MSAGELLPDGSLECAWHGARFDPVTGQPRRGPACEALRVYRVLVLDGIVHVASSP